MVRTMRPSLPMRMNALGANSSAASASLCRPTKGKLRLSIRPPPAPLLPAGACVATDCSRIRFGPGPGPARCDRGSWSASLSRGLRGLFDRFANAQIGPAAADVARHRIVDVRVGWMRVVRQQRRSGHDLARLAIATLRHLAV